MAHETPLATMNTLVAGRDAGDIDTTVECYEADATIVAAPGRVLSGTASVRATVAGFIALRPHFAIMKRDFLAMNDLALHHAAWILEGTAPDGAAFTLSGTTADVLRRQSDGRWLVAIDNPWGGDILG